MESARKDNLAILRQILADQRDHERELMSKYPWVNMVYNWIVAALLVTLAVMLIVWGVDVRTQKRADEQTAIALASYQEEQRAQEEARLAELKAIENSAQAVMRKEAQDGAKALYGIRNFISKYGYNAADLKTYIRCIIDRVEFGKSINSFHAIVAQESQFLGYSDNNPVLDEYYKIAYEEIEKWHNESSKPWDSSYRFAELTEHGIWLTSEFGADGYARRVRYTE